jgi:hypothetical protein
MGRAVEIADSDLYVNDFLATPDGLALVKAFMRIQDLNGVRIPRSFNIAAMARRLRAPFYLPTGSALRRSLCRPPVRRRPANRTRGGQGRHPARSGSRTCSHPTPRGTGSSIV